MRDMLRGVIAAIATAVDEEGEPDCTRSAALARFLLANGCSALNVLGTTGEATSFSLEQRKRVMTAYRENGLALDRLMVGTGAAALADAVALTRHAARLGFAGALLLPPFYYKGVPDEGLLAYVEGIVNATSARPIPLYLYHFPAQSGLPWPIPLVKRLLETFGTRIVGLKDSSGDMTYARQAAAISPAFAVFPSTEAVLMQARSGSSLAAFRPPPISTPIYARGPGAAAMARPSTPRFASANCSMASRWSRASRHLSPISTATRRGHGSSPR